MSVAMVAALGVVVSAALARAAVGAARRGHVGGRVLQHDQSHLASLPGLPGLDTLVASVRRRWAERPAVHQRQLAAELPAALDEVARQLRAGSSIHQAIAHAARTEGAVAGAALRHVATSVEMGLALPVSLTQLVADEPQAEVRLVAAALGVASQAGGRAADAVDAVADSLRARRAAIEEIAAHSVQARLSAVVIALLPLVFTAWCVATDDRAAAFLLASAGGWLCLASGLALLSLGGWWMARIVRSAS